MFTFLLTFQWRRNEINIAGQGELEALRAVRDGVLGDGVNHQLMGLV